MSPAIDAAVLDRRVKLLRPIYASEFEDEIGSYEEAAEVWAGVQPMTQNTRERNLSARTVAIVSALVILRYRSDIDARWRISDGTMTLAILGIVDVLRRHVQLQITCEEVQ